MEINYQTIPQENSYIQGIAQGTKLQVSIVYSKNRNIRVVCHIGKISVISYYEGQKAMAI